MTAHVLLVPWWWALVLVTAGTAIAFAIVLDAPLHRCAVYALGYAAVIVEAGPNATRDTIAIPVVTTHRGASHTAVVAAGVSNSDVSVFIDPPPLLAYRMVFGAPPPRAFWVDRRAQPELRWSVDGEALLVLLDVPRISYSAWCADSLLPFALLKADGTELARLDGSASTAFRDIVDAHGPYTSSWTWHRDRDGWCAPPAEAPSSLSVPPSEAPATLDGASYSSACPR